MPPTSNRVIGNFSGKPTSNVMYAAIESYAPSLGSVTKHLTTQMSFSVNRKFLWVWVYERTGDGILFLNVRLDRPVEDPHVHRVDQASASRWNHHVVVRTMEVAQSDWFRDLIRAGHKFAAR